MPNLPRHVARADAPAGRAVMPRPSVRSAACSTLYRPAGMQAKARLDAGDTINGVWDGFRFSAEIIAHAVWLYPCSSLSLRDVATILAERGILQPSLAAISVSHSSRRWK